MKSEKEIEQKILWAQDKPGVMSGIDIEEDPDLEVIRLLDEDNAIVNILKWVLEKSETIEPELCETCRFCLLDEKDQTLNQNIWGTCRLNPPSGYRRKVSASDWCGQFERK